MELKDGQLSGTKIAVPDAEVATHAVVVANNGDSVSLCVADLNSDDVDITCLLYTSPSPRDNTTSRMPSSA